MDRPPSPTPKILSPLSRRGHCGIVEAMKPGHAAFFVLALAMLDGRFVLAGACTEGDDRFYVEELERIARRRAKPGTVESPFICLDISFGIPNRWAGPRAAKKIARYHASPLRPRIVKACSRIIKGDVGRSRYWQAKHCVQLLATYGVQEIDGKRTLALRTRYFPHGFDPERLASLGDPAAIPLLVERFGAKRQCYEARGDNDKPDNHCTDFTHAAKNRWTRKAQQEAKIAVLNALWHLAHPSMRPFIDEVAAKDPDPLIRRRAKKVAARLSNPSKGKK